MIMRRTALNLALAGYAVLLGCEQPTVGFYETKTIEERLTNADITAVVAVLEAVDEKSPAELPFPFLPPPVWSESRTLPVSELLAAEEDALQSVWSPDDAASRIPSGEPWDSALKNQKLTREQFCSLVLSVSAALGRGSADRSVSLKLVAERGKRELASLVDDERPFSSLTSDERHQAQNQAIWLTIRDRAEKLALVPQANVEAAASAGPALRHALGDEYFADPFAGLYPRPEDSGVPFEEGELSDADLTWSDRNAITGFTSTTAEPLSSLKAFDRQ